MDGNLFRPLRNADYVVLQLGQCPAGSFSFSRYFNNEDEKNNSYSVGNISPNVIAEFKVGEWPPTPDKDTRLYFCFFSRDSASGVDRLPYAGAPYGVFAAPNGPWLSTGYVLTDDEDECCTKIDDPYISLTTGPGSWFDAFNLIIYEGKTSLTNYSRNSILLTAKAHDGVPDCTGNVCEPWGACEAAYVEWGRFGYLDFFQTRRCCRNSEWVTERGTCGYEFTVDTGLQASRLSDEGGRQRWTLDTTMLAVDLAGPRRTFLQLELQPTFAFGVGAATATLENPFEPFHDEMRRGLVLSASAGTVIRPRGAASWSGRLQVEHRRFFDEGRSASNPFEYRGSGIVATLQRSMWGGRITPGAGIRFLQSRTAISPVDTTQLVAGVDFRPGRSLIVRTEAFYARHHQELLVSAGYRIPFVRYRPR